MNPSADTWEEIVNFIITIANTSVTYGINMAGSHLNTTSSSDTTVDTEYYGDPTRHDKGIPISVHKSTEYTDQYIKFLSATTDICGFPGPEDTVVKYEDKVYSYDFQGGLLAVPQYETTTVTTGVMQILNMNSSLANDRDVAPKLLSYPLIDSPKNAMDIIVHLACAYIIKNYSVEAIAVYCSIGNPTFPWELFKKKMDKLNDPIGDEVFETLANLKRTTALYEQTRKKLHDQLFMSVDMEAISLLVANGDHEQAISEYAALGELTTKFNYARNKVNADYIQYNYQKIKVNYVSYNICGVNTLVTNNVYVLANNGTIFRSSNNTRTVITESIIKHIRLIKRSIKYPTQHAGHVFVDSRQKYNTIQLATTNWEDVKRAFWAAATIVVQASDTYSFMTSDYDDVKSIFDYLSSFPGAQSVRINYSFATNQGTATVSNIEAY